MNIREAILKAALLFETRPDRYSYINCEVPDCESPGGMVGWILHYCGVERVERDAGETLSSTARKSIGFDWIAIEQFADSEPATFDGYLDKAAQAAKLLRAYADHRFPATKADVCT